MISEALYRLRGALEKYKITCLRIAEDGDEIGEGVEPYLSEIFKYCPLNVTFTKGRIIYPKEEGASYREVSL